jgi:hypothetical protein
MLQVLLHSEENQAHLLDQILPFVWISLSIGSFVSKIQRRATDIAEIVTPSQRIYIAMGDTSGGY